MLILSSFAFAVLGGLLLNVMPCVFPILSLKAMSLAKVGGSEADAKRDAVAYAAGVIAVCGGLGATIIALRAGGTQIGWAFQLQDPRVVLALVVLMTAVTLNLAGLFEITLSSGSAGQSLVTKSGAAGSFWTGALAAFIATPCTGPFMAGALGAALVLPPIAGILVFAGLGLGLSLPFLAIGFVPAIRRRMPRPGAWMATLRVCLSLPMFATVLALIWLLSRENGINGAEAGAAAALVTGLLLWGLGLYQHQGPARVPLLALIPPFSTVAFAIIAGATGHLEIINVNWHAVTPASTAEIYASNEALLTLALSVLAVFGGGVVFVVMLDSLERRSVDSTWFRTLPVVALQFGAIIFAPPYVFLVLSRIEWQWTIPTAVLLAAIVIVGITIDFVARAQRWLRAVPWLVLSFSMIMPFAFLTAVNQAFGKVLRNIDHFGVPTNIAAASTAYWGAYLLMIAYSTKPFFDEAVRRRNGARGQAEPRQG